MLTGAAESVIGPLSQSVTAQLFGGLFCHLVCHPLGTVSAERMVNQSDSF